MPCLEPEDLIARWDGPLSANERQAQTRHMAECERCQRLEGSLRRLAERLPGAFSGRGLGSTDACLSETALIELCRDRLDRKDAEAARTHLLSCRHCAGQLALVTATLAKPLPADDALLPAAIERALPLARRSPTSTQSWRWAASAAMAAGLMAVCFGILWKPPADLSGTDRPGVRVLQAPAALPAVTSPSEGQRVHREHLELHWQELPDARRYVVKLLDRRGDVIWKTTTTETTRHVPVGLALEPGTRYFVSVTAELEDGRSVRAPAVAFVVESRTNPC